MARLELFAAGVSILLGLVGYLLVVPTLELLGVVGAVFAFGLLVARQ